MRRYPIEPISRMAPGGRVPATLYLVDGPGAVAESGDGGPSWSGRGDIAGEPAAFESVGDELYVALHDGTIKRSEDDGRAWEVRSQP